MNENVTGDAGRSEDGRDAGERDRLMAEAVRVLTAAARLTRPVQRQDESASEEAGHPVWVDSGRREPADWAEFVTLALAGAAANIGGIEAVLAGRPGSWEADGVRQLLASTVGYDQQYLLEHRTEPVVVDIYVDELMVDLGLWESYNKAAQELIRRYDALGMPVVTEWVVDPDLGQIMGELPPATEEQERQAEAINELEEALERLRLQDYAAYGAALRAHIEDAATRQDGLRVPVVVNVDLETFRQDPEEDGAPYRVTAAVRLLDGAVAATPLPGDGRDPLDRLESRVDPIAAAVTREAARLDAEQDRSDHLSEPPGSER